MFNIKSILIAGCFVMMAQTLLAQESEKKDPNQVTTPASSPQWSNRDMTYRGKNYDVLDSAYYPKHRKKQFKKYIDHQEVFPPKPRNMWEVGGGLGLFNVVGNVPTLFLWQKGGGGISINVRKSLGYIFSLRAQYIYGVGKNLDRQPTISYDAPYTQFGYIPMMYATPNNPANAIYRSTRTEASQLSLDLMFNLYNINFHNASNSVAFFGYAGIGALAYKTRVNALNDKYREYDFGTIVANPAASTSSIRNDLQSKMDKTYETAAENGGGGTILDKKTLDFAPSLGVGVQYKFNKKMNIQLEDRYTFTADGYLDGSRYGKPLGNVPTIGRQNESINYFSVSLNYNVPNKKKSVEPLYWINPLDHSYSELSYPRHMILPNPVLPDEDNDGVTDQFDKCPKTPKGVAVDAHGCPLDTDGDGVPDYKDKQLITPTECQPVDADGIGKCPCPDDCLDKIGADKTKVGKCGLIKEGTLLFTSGSNRITTAMEAKLAMLAQEMTLYPLCKVVILGGGSGSKTKEQKSWEHVNALIEYMSEKNNIARERFYFKYGEAVGDENTVIYRPATDNDQGTSNVPPPHPDMARPDK